MATEESDFSNLIGTDSPCRRMLETTRERNEADEQREELLREWVQSSECTA